MTSEHCEEMFCRIVQVHLSKIRVKRRAQSSGAPKWWVMYRTEPGLCSLQESCIKLALHKHSFSLQCIKLALHKNGCLLQCIIRHLSTQQHVERLQQAANCIQAKMQSWHNILRRSSPLKSSLAVTFSVASDKLWHQQQQQVSVCQWQYLCTDLHFISPPWIQPQILPDQSFTGAVYVLPWAGVSNTWKVMTEPSTAAAHLTVQGNWGLPISQLLKPSQICLPPPTRLVILGYYACAIILKL